MANTRSSYRSTAAAVMRMSQIIVNDWGAYSPIGRRKSADDPSDDPWLP